EYTIAHLREALARDDRTNVLDVSLHLDAGTLFLTGQVDSEERRKLIELVARENLPEGIEIVNELRVATYGQPETENVG
ncbi:MAG: BON domain-containing protein, partial [Vicinamibacteria bacterium]